MDGSKRESEGLARPTVSAAWAKDASCWVDKTGWLKVKLWICLLHTTERRRHYIFRLIEMPAPPTRGLVIHLDGNPEQVKDVMFDVDDGVYSASLKPLRFNGGEGPGDTYDDVLSVRRSKGWS